MIRLSLSNNTQYEATLTPIEPRFRFAWDDEISSYNYKCRTQMPDAQFDSDNPPAVIDFFSVMNERDRQRINLEKDPTWRWKETIIALNGGGEQGARAWGYLVGPHRAQFNDTGWPMMGYIGMCGNELEILEMGLGWVKFKTLKPQDWLAARSMSIQTRPMYIHRFTCVSWDRETRTTVRINSTGTPRGDVFYPLVTNEGYSWVPRRFVVQIG